MSRHLLLLLVLAACQPAKFSADAGFSLETPVVAMIGSEGGSLVSRDGRLVVSIPRGSLSSTYPISVEAITAAAPGSIGSWRIGPVGLSLSQSATLTFAPSPVDLEGTVAEALVLVSHKSDGTFFINHTEHAALTGAASMTTRTGGDVDVVPLVKLSPGRVTLHDGESVTVSLTDCGPPPDSDFAGECRTPPADFVSSWSVMGEGSVEPASTSAVYRAPAMGTDSVATVRVKTFVSRLSKTIELSARIDLLRGPPAYVGTFSVVGASESVSASVRFERATLDGDEESFRAVSATGTISTQCMNARVTSTNVIGSWLYVNAARREYRMQLNVEVAGQCDAMPVTWFAADCNELGTSACFRGCSSITAAQLRVYPLMSVGEIRGSDSTCAPSRTGSWSLVRE